MNYRGVAIFIHGIDSGDGWVDQAYTAIGYADPNYNAVERKVHAWANENQVAPGRYLATYTNEAGQRRYYVFRIEHDISVTIRVYID